MTDEVKGALDADTPNAPDGAAVDEQGVGQAPTDSTDPDVNADPKSGGTPVHPSPGADSQAGGGAAEGGVDSGA